MGLMMCKMPAIVAAMLLAATSAVAAPFGYSAGSHSMAVQAAAKRSHMVRVTGTALYFAKINPLPGSRLIVSVVDAGRADASATVLARKSYAIKAIPARFALNVSGKALQAGGAGVSLRAEIHGPGGQLMWVTDTHIPVVARPGSKTVNVGDIVLTGVK